MEAKEDSEAKEDLEAREAKEAKEVKNFVHAFVLPLPWAFTIGISVFVRSAVLHLQPLHLHRIENQNKKHYKALSSSF